MKRSGIIILLSALLMVAGVGKADAKDFFRFGIKAGLNFTNMSGVNDVFEDNFLKTYTGFNAGLIFNFDLPLGFEISPELLYVHSGQRLEANAFGDAFTASGTLSNGTLRLPINIQWGIGIKNIIKPYVVVSPYVGGVLFGKVKGEISSIIGANGEGNICEHLNRFQYGIGVGAGIYIWKFQVAFKWNWDLNPTFKQGEGLSFGDEAKFNGGELSVGFLF